MHPVFLGRASREYKIKLNKRDSVIEVEARERHFWQRLSRWWLTKEADTVKQVKGRLVWGSYWLAVMWDPEH